MIPVTMLMEHSFSHDTKDGIQYLYTFIDMFDVCQLHPYRLSHTKLS